MQAPRTQTLDFKPFIDEINKLQKLEELQASRLVEIARPLANSLIGIIKSNRQIRRFHEYIVRFATDFAAGRVKIGEIKLLNYHMVYAAARVDKKDVKEAMKKLAAFFDAMLKKTNTPGDLKKLRQMSEAIVAYHKLFGGRD